MGIGSQGGLGVGDKGLGVTVGRGVNARLRQNTWGSDGSAYEI